MHYYFLLAIVFGFTGFVVSQTTISGSFDHGGINRTYSFYVPASYSPGTAVPLIVDLHGLGSDGAAHAERSKFEDIADTANFIVVHPDGSHHPFINQRFWNYGNIVGATVDDVAFLVALIDTISTQYSIDQDRVYCSGMSNGSFMAYCLACETDRFAAVGGVTGSMSTDMHANCNPARPTPTIHIHGTADQTNPYNGTSTMVGIEEMSLFWANQNGCSTTPAITPVPDLDLGDEATAERYLYSGGINNHTVELFKVTNGGHTWPGYYVFGFNGNTCMDFSATLELWRFFSQYERMNAAEVEQHTPLNMRLLPNPSNGIVRIEVGNHTVTRIAVIDAQGRIVRSLKGTALQQIDVSGLGAGNYHVLLTGADFHVIQRLIVTP